MTAARSWLRRWNVAFGFFSVTTIVFFVEGSATFDAVRHAHPSSERLKALVASNLPREYDSFFVRGVEVTENTQMTAVRLAQREDLLSPTDLATAAKALGDDPSGYEAALAAVSRIPQGTVPPLPPPLPQKQLFASQKAAGSERAITIDLSVAKRPLGWGLLDCWQRWLHEPRWEVRHCQFPPLPAEYTSLIPRRLLGSNALVLGESHGDRFLKDYVERRREFINAVRDAVRSGKIRSVVLSLREELQRDLFPSDRFALEIAEDTEAPTESGLVHLTLKLTQTVDLYQPAPSEDAAWQVSSLARATAATRAAAAEHLLDVPECLTSEPKFYRLVSPAGSVSLAKIRVSEADVTSDSILRSLQWVRGGEGLADLVAAQDAGANAVFSDGAAGLLTAERYRATAEAFVSEAQDALRDLDRRWGSDQNARRLVAKAIAAHGGRENILRLRSFLEEVTGTGRLPDGRQVSVQGNRRLALPFRLREDFTFAADKFESSQTETLDSSGVWRSVKGVIRPTDLLGPEEAALRRQRVYAEHLLYHLVDPAGEPVVLKSIGGAAPRVTVDRPGAPSVLLTFDTAQGYLIRWEYRETQSDSEHLVQGFLSEFSFSDGVLRPNATTIAVDGIAVSNLRVLRRTTSTFSREDFRHPYSPGRPFVRRDGTPTHEVTFEHQIMTTQALICLDDDPQTIPLRFRESVTLSLAEGEHSLTMVVWGQGFQIAVNRPPIDFAKRTVTFLVNRDGTFSIVSDRSVPEGIAWRY